MEILRWILAVACLAYFAGGMAILAGLAIRRLRTGKDASGLVFVPSAVALIGILIMPVSSFSDRFPFAFVPFLVESLYFVFGLVMDFLPRTPSD